MKEEIHRRVTRVRQDGARQGRQAEEPLTSSDREGLGVPASPPCQEGDGGAVSR